MHFILLNIEVYVHCTPYEALYIYMCVCVWVGVYNIYVSHDHLLKTMFNAPITERKHVLTGDGQQISAMG